MPFTLDVNQKINPHLRTKLLNTYSSLRTEIKPGGREASLNDEKPTSFDPS